MKFIIYILFFIVFFLFYVRYIESYSIFLPSRQLLYDPSRIGLSFEDVYIKTEDNVTLHGWLIKGSHKHTLIFFHGNAGNIGDRLDKLGLFNQIGVNTLIIDYRGYGKSKGKPNEKGMYKDAIAAYDYLVTREDIDSNYIVAYGASLGGAAAVDLATKRTLAALIIDSTFTSAKDVAKALYPFIPSFLIRTELDSLSKIKGISIPKLIIHSADDEMIPIAFGRRLYEAAPPPKEFLEIRGGHNDSHFHSYDEFSDGIANFLKKIE